MQVFGLLGEAVPWSSCDALLHIPEFVLQRDVAMAAASVRINAETPVANRTVHELEQTNRHRMHMQRLHDISVSGKRRADLGNSWKVGPQRTKPTYPHLRDNLKKQQVESERFDTIERENRLLLEKMSALMASGSVLDPTEGTWEFQPGVRLNRFQARPSAQAL